MAGTVAATGFLLVGAASLPPREAPRSEWPLDRLIANLDARVEASPADAEAHYNLGRAHAFAFALERPSLWATGRPTKEEPRDRDGWVDDLDRQRRLNAASKESGRLEAAELLDHLTAGVRHLRDACSLDGTGGYVWFPITRHLTLAWLLETGAHLAALVDTPDLFGLASSATSGENEAEAERWIRELGSDDQEVASAARAALRAPERLESAVNLLWSRRFSVNPGRQKAVAELLETYWVEQAIAKYWQAFDLATKRELFEGRLSIRGRLEDHVSYEALDSLRRLLNRRGVRPDEERRLADAEEKWKRLEALPRGYSITPVLVPSACCRLEDCIAPDLEVPFDLDGDGVDELWPWIAPEAGWLVWDPNRRGEITSGRQLFGSASAWLFFEDGYRVLGALDDDRDGELRGAELTGIAVWFDRDTDGVSDRGEVVPVEELGIVALATRAALTVGASPANLCGLELADGRVLPTYDWVLAPVTGL